MEIWKDIKGYEKLYQISNKGRLKRLTNIKNNNGGIQITPEKIVDVNLYKGNIYKKIKLTKDKNFKMFLVHRLVADAFISNPNNYEFVNHIDFNTLNNNVENLEWCTRIQNINHSKKNGRYKGKYDNLIKENLELKNKIKELEANCYKVGE